MTARPIGNASVTVTNEDTHDVRSVTSDYGGSAGVAASHLMTYDLRSGKIEDLGEMHLPDGRPVLGTNVADTVPDGTLYMEERFRERLFAWPCSSFIRRQIRTACDTMGFCWRLHSAFYGGFHRSARAVL